MGFLQFFCRIFAEFFVGFPWDLCSFCRVFMIFLQFFAGFCGIFCGIFARFLQFLWGFYCSPFTEFFCLLFVELSWDLCSFCGILHFCRIFVGFYCRVFAAFLAGFLRDFLQGFHWIYTCWKFSQKLSSATLTLVSFQNCHQPLSVPLFHCISLHFKTNWTVFNIFRMQNCYY